MKTVVVAAALALGALGTGSVLAGPRCNVPMADWQPREALQKKVEAEGWKVTRIKTDDGCYEVHAINDQGQRYEGKFDPGTLKALKVEIERK
jgi:hypothetical protein